MDARRADLLVGLLTGALTWAPADPDADPSDPDPDSSSGTGTGGPSGGCEVARSEGVADVVAGTDDVCDAGAAVAAEDGAGGGDGTDGGGDGSSAAAGTGRTPAGNGGGSGGTGGSGTALLPRPVNPCKPLVQVLMPFTTLLGLDQQPCELVGHGPIPAELAREIAADATLKRLVYDPLSGTVLNHGRTTYRPPAGLADHVRARDVHCRSPICRRRVLDGHLDHVVPFPDGPTNDTNLHGCCGHDHRRKHAPGWSVRALPDGRIQWITPTRHRYHSDPHDYRDETGPAAPRAVQSHDGPDEPKPPPTPRWTQQDFDRRLARRPDDDALEPDDEGPAPF